MAEHPRRKPWPQRESVISTSSGWRSGETSPSKAA
jgi:hypothetical protein